MRITVETALQHGLTADEYARIEAALQRTPTIEELGVFSVMWSEHCSYKSSRAYLRGLPTSGPRVLQGPGENAGALDVGDGLAVVFKIESHNHPSFVEPFQGAATGVGGILRDIFTMGARPIANLNSLRFGGIAHPRTAYLVGGVVGGIGHYGNCIGVATVGGEVAFDPGYDHNILVNAFTLGVVGSDRIFRARAEGVGNPVMYVGSKTGKDGIHGASLLASAEFDADSESKRPTVQVGDPFTEKLLLEACLALMSPAYSDHLVGIQDMGAAGLTSSSVEMAGRGGSGIDLDLSRVPLREQGMTPYDILLSESQERMLLVVHKGSEDVVRELFAKWDLDAAVIGHVTDTGRLRATWEGRQVVDMPIAPLTDGAPVYHRPAVEPSADDGAKLVLRELAEPRDYNQILLQLLESPNLCSREWVYRQYDTYVGGNTVVRPGSDAAVVRLDGTQKAVAMTLDCNSRLCLLDPYVGTVSAVAEAARNLAASGAEPIGVTNCLNFGSPEKPEVMWQFQQAIAGLRDACVAFGTPVVSGNVSFYNETEGRSIPPTPVIGMVGLLEDVGQHVTQWFKGEGDAIVLLGRNREELGGSEYLAVVHHQVRGTLPWIDLDIERRLIRSVLHATREGLLRSAHDVSEGGLAVALAECCITSESGPHLGAHIDELEGGIRADALLFGESHGRIIVSVRRRNLTRLREIARREDVVMTTIGEVRGHRLEINDLVDLPVTTIRERWRGALQRALAGSPGE
ncbi:MAG TPA: phosphoribosylformylglycinamidine synthase subunit PurL [Candidatus Binatia bacterium]|jgi:phosphoribosylformylglycinamidine synthase